MLRRRLSYLLSASATACACSVLSDPRLVIVFSAYTFSMLYEIMSGYLRGFGVSLVPAVLTMIGVCGIRIAWIELVFPKNHNFETIMTVYPISLAATALLIFIALLIYRPSHRFANKQSAE